MQICDSEGTGRGESSGRFFLWWDQGEEMKIVAVETEIIEKSIKHLPGTRWGMVG